MSGEFWLIETPEQLQSFCKHLPEFYEVVQGPILASYEVYKSPRTPSQNSKTEQEEDPRTIQQNYCIHGYIAALARDLNAAGLDIRRTMAADFDIPWTEASVKALIWHEVQRAMYPDKPASTKALSTKEVGEVYKVIARHMAQKQITTPFPTRHNSGGKDDSYER